MFNRNFSAGAQCIPNDTKVTLIKDESDIKVNIFFLMEIRFIDIILSAGVR
jgi:hypothetical protein